MKGKKRLFYGWVIVCAGMAVMGAVVGCINNAFGLFIIPACEELGFTRRAMGATQTMLLLGNMVVTLFSGTLFKPDRIRRMMCVGGVMMCASFALFALAKRLWQFYVIALLCASMQTLVNVVPFAIIIGNWFHEKRGLALGMTYMGSGIGGVLFNAVGGRSIETLGWRATVIVFALMMAVAVLPSVFFIIRISPVDMGLSPLGEKQHDEREATGLTTWQTLRTARFYVIALDVVLAGLAVNSTSTTMAAYYTDGFGAASAGALVATLFMAVLAAGKMLLGGLYDKLGCRRATVLTRVLLVIGLVALSGGSRIVCIALFLLACGVANASNSVTLPMLALANFGTISGATITGIFNSLQYFGGMFAPILSGWVCDVTGSYAPAYRIFAIAVALMVLPMWFSLRDRPE